jgi:hypothetical protein
VPVSSCRGLNNSGNIVTKAAANKDPVREPIPPSTTIMMAFTLITKLKVGGFKKFA